MKRKQKHDSVRVLIFLGCIWLASLTRDPLVFSASNNIEDQLFKKIETAAGINNLESAKDDIKRVLKLNPKHAGAIFYAGSYCYQTGDFEKAEKFLKRVINDSDYGSKANGVLADIRLKKYSKRFMGTLKVYLSGESFGQALQLCEEALLDMPDNTELLFSAAYSSCMLGKKDRAESYTELYTTRATNQELAAELKTLVDAWFTESFDDQIAIEKFLSLKDKRLLTAPVKRKIKKLLISNKAIDRYADFIRKEAAQPGADRDSLERELITFMLEQNQFNKAFELIDKRPTDSIDDNLLYIWALHGTNQHEKALSVAKTLMSVAPRDLRVYRAWVEAWLSYTIEKAKMPDLKDKNDKSYNETMERIFELLRPDKLVTQEPVLLINMLRMANFSDKDEECFKIQSEVAKIAFTDEHEKILLKAVDELVAFDKLKSALNILESASNQLPENYNIALKLATIYMDHNPTASIRICEDVMEQRPDLIRAFTTWCDAMNKAGRGGEAISEILKRLEDSSLNDLVRRQLNAKLENLRMAGNTDKAYEPDKVLKNDISIPEANENLETEEEAKELPDDSLLDEITKFDNENDDDEYADNLNPPETGIDTTNDFSSPEEEDYDEELDY